MYDNVKRLYLTGRIDEYGFDNAVKFNWITEEQKDEIIASKQKEID